MKSLSIFITASIIICGISTASAQNENSSGEKIIMHPIPKTEQNSIGMQMPLPHAWTLNNNAPDGQPIITAPGEIEVYAYPQPQEFLYANDSVTLKYYHDAMGTPTREAKGIDNIIENDIKPLAEKNGYKFLKQYPLKDIAMNIATFTATLYNPLNMNNLVQASGTEWTDKNGNMLLIVLQYTETGSATDILSWGYSAHSLQAPPNEFEAARDHFIYGLINLQYNPDDISAYNKAQSAEWNKSQGSYDEPYNQDKN
ncbi:hypothetical protein G3O08_03600 [Cryomorpha ignava]|uniref:DUF1795 domain-containing protein n=1 Tax=Cryomorpha ignava TaxID=101383 RepID=A0A7K3WM39_9FLAO|nr:hypothetical protein [Cryomorpha ignava]NEN22588.1 hypothetical protein [Cryomorpha ignava]